MGGASLTKILYESLLQSVQLTLEGSEVGGSAEIFAMVSGPVTVSTLVRVSVTQKLGPSLRQSILRIVG